MQNGGESVRDRLDVIEHLISVRNIHSEDEELFKLILEELRMLRGKTDESGRLIKGVREATWRREQR